VTSSRGRTRSTSNAPPGTFQAGCRRRRVRTSGRSLTAGRQTPDAPWKHAVSPHWRRPPARSSRGARRTRCSPSPNRSPARSLSSCPRARTRSAGPSSPAAPGRSPPRSPRTSSGLAARSSPTGRSHRSTRRHRARTAVARGSLVRAPSGRHTLWAYCHLPNGTTVDMTDRMLAQIERCAPGVRGRILAPARTRPPARTTSGNDGRGQGQGHGERRRVQGRVPARQYALRRRPSASRRPRYAVSPIARAGPGTAAAVEGHSHERLRPCQRPHHRRLRGRVNGGRRVGRSRRQQRSER
jgi:hypothetical protein